MIASCHQGVGTTHSYQNTLNKLLWCPCSAMRCARGSISKVAEKIVGFWSSDVHCHWSPCFSEGQFVACDGCPMNGRLWYVPWTLHCLFWWDRTCAWWLECMFHVELPNTYAISLLGYIRSFWSLCYRHCQDLLWMLGLRSREQRQSLQSIAHHYRALCQVQ